MKKLRLVVLDTNALIQILGAYSKYHSLWDAFLAGKYILCISNEILHEYEEILAQKASALAAQMFMRVISYSKNIICKNPYYSFGLIEQDWDDNKFVDCAIACGADYIVTNDAHFNCLHTIPFPVVRVLNIDAFLEDMQSPTL